MQVVIVEPEKKPFVQNIDDTLTSMQHIVGGTIQAVYPFEEPVALICNDEGKLLNLPLNRALETALELSTTSWRGPSSSARPQLTATALNA